MLEIKITLTEVKNAFHGLMMEITQGSFKRNCSKRAKAEEKEVMSKDFGAIQKV
jgi:hypothetical protein